MQNNDNTADREFPANCVTHDLVKIKFFKIFKTCSICKYYKAWPWVTMFKCRSCKIISHQRCLQKTKVKNETSPQHEESILEATPIESPQQSSLIHRPLTLRWTTREPIDTENEYYEFEWITAEFEPIDVENEMITCYQKTEIEENGSINKAVSLLLETIHTNQYFQDNDWYIISEISKDGEVFYVITKSNNNMNTVASIICLRRVMTTDVFAIIIKIWVQAFLPRIDLGVEDLT